MYVMIVITTGINLVNCSDAFNAEVPIVSKRTATDNNANVFISMVL